MKLLNTYFPEVKIITPQIYNDERGMFFESYNLEKFNNLINLDIQFVQDNHSLTSFGVLRGLHYQIERPQGKLIRVVKGKIYDVVVDLRLDSPTFGDYMGIEISADSGQQLWVPVGFAHGFYVLSDTAEVLYKMTDYWFPNHERCLLWSDTDIGIKWPFRGSPIQSKKDSLGSKFSNCDYFVCRDRGL
jgi:dTDP-4-dehydrorhamnose 3,5-epimerase